MSKEELRKRIAKAKASAREYFSELGKKLSLLTTFETFEEDYVLTDTERHIERARKIAVTLAVIIAVIIIIILLLRCCGSGIGGGGGSIDIPGNVIDPSHGKTADLDFTAETDEENRPFDEDEMVFGDKVSGLFRVSATYNSDFTLKFDMTIRDHEDFEKLAEVLKVKVELILENGDVMLYDGLLKDMPPLDVAMTADGMTTEEFLYRVTVYLDPSLPQEYLGKELVADMTWWVEGYDSVTVANSYFATAHPYLPPDVPAEPTIDFIYPTPAYNQPFDIDGINDGYSATKHYAFEITHETDVTLKIDSNVVINTSPGETIDETLYVKVEAVINGVTTTVYEGLLKDLSAEIDIPANDTGKTEVRFNVTVMANGVTEEHCDAKFVCDFSFAIAGTAEELKIPNNKFVSYPKPIPPATSIELTPKDDFVDTPFYEDDILPGDYFQKYYCITVNHHDYHVVSFSVDVEPGSKIHDVLRIKIDRLIPDAPDVVLYDGLMKNCTAVDISVPESPTNVTEIYYRITVYTNGAEVTNEHAGASLFAHFEWKLK